MFKSTSVTEVDHYTFNLDLKLGNESMSVSSSSVVAILDRTIALDKLIRLTVILGGTQSTTKVLNKIILGL